MATKSNHLYCELQILDMKTKEIQNKLLKQNELDLRDLMNEIIKRVFVKNVELTYVSYYLSDFNENLITTSFSLTFIFQANIQYKVKIEYENIILSCNISCKDKDLDGFYHLRDDVFASRHSDVDENIEEFLYSNTNNKIFDRFAQIFHVLLTCVGTQRLVPAVMNNIDMFMNCWDAEEYFVNTKYKNKFYNSKLRNVVLYWFKDRVKCEETYGHISHWDTELVTCMFGLFNFNENFNEPLYWNTSNVTNMTNMFLKCKSFDQCLNFDMSKVTERKDMFTGSNGSLYK
jgi:hypothetical protein